jgi:hypothetical protein
MNVRMLGIGAAMALVAFAADSKPIQLKASLAGDNQRYVGTWQAKAASNNVRKKFDNTVLIVMPNGDALYERCAGQVDGGSSRLSGTTLSDVVVGSIEDGRLTLARPTFPYVRERSFKLDRAPFQHDGDWYMVLDGVTLRKLGANESSDFASWECP